MAAVLAAADGDAGSRVASPQSAQHIVPYRTVPLLLPPFAPPPPWLTSFCLRLVIRLGHFWLSCIFMICLLPLFRIFTTSQRDRLLPPKLNNSHVLLSRYPGRSLDPIGYAQSESEREILLQILIDVQLSSDDYQYLLQ